MMKRQVEVFTAGCPVCEPVVSLVKEMAGKNCEVTIHNLSKQDQNRIGIDKVKEYGVKRLPAIAINGNLLECCKNNEITKDDLIKGGVGEC